MSDFIRPEVKVWFERNQELLFAVFLLILGLIGIGRGVFLGATLSLAVGGTLFLIALPLIRRSAMRLKLTRGQAAGIVLIDERRIGFLGPDGGGFLESDHLHGVDLRISDGVATWTLIGEEGQSLMVPVKAKGGEALYDRFTSLPGFSLSTALDLIEANAEGSHRIWRNPDLKAGSAALLSGDNP
ncbi:MAG: hypothetical protein AAFQ36_00630 [Pseudomonadota bacterium]